MSVFRGSKEHLLGVLKNTVARSVETLAKYPDEPISERENMITFLNGFNGASDDFILKNREEITPRVMAIANILHLLESRVLNRNYEEYLIRERERENESKSESKNESKNEKTLN